MPTILLSNGTHTKAEPAHALSLHQEMHDRSVIGMPVDLTPIAAVLTIEAWTGEFLPNVPYTWTFAANIAELRHACNRQPQLSSDCE